MQKEVLVELKIFLKDFELDGIQIKDIPCDSKSHNKEKGDICRFFDSCPFPSLVYG